MMGGPVCPHGWSQCDPPKVCVGGCLDFRDAAAGLATLAAPKLKLYGITEIAEATGHPASMISVWVSRGKLPEPYQELVRVKVWAGPEIEAWIQENRAVQV